MIIQPLGDRVLVKLIPAEEKTSSGIILTTATQEKTNQGNIIAIGDSADIKVTVGQNIMYDRYAGTSIKIDGAEHMILSYKDILAVIK